MKRHLVLICIAFAGAIGLGAYFAPETFWQPLLINLATVFFGASLAILLVNIYLERDARKQAVQALLALASEGIGDFHNTFLDIIWTKFGKDDFGDPRTKYKKADGDIMVLTPEQRKGVYDLAKEHQTRLNPLLERLDQSLAEAVALVGWSLDHRFLTQALQARSAIRRYRSIDLDDSDESIQNAAKRIIDIDTCSADAYHILKELSGRD